MRLLRGLFSQIAWGLSQFQVLGVPGHLLATLGLLGAGVAMGFPLAYALTHREPVYVSITALATGESDETHVTVSGFANYGSVLIVETSEQRSGQVTNQEHHWQLVDQKGPGRLFVHSDDDPSGRQPESVTLTGRLRRPPRILRERLAEFDGPGQPTLSERVLEPGQGVLPAGVAIGVMIPSVIGALLILLGSRNHFTAFFSQPFGSGVKAGSPPTAERPLACQATGSIALRMPGGNVRRVNGRDITCQIVPGQTEEGHPLGHFLLSRVAAGGVVLESEMALPPGTPAETGIVMRGLSGRPALRVRCEDFDGHLLFRGLEEALAARAAITRP